MIPEAFRVVRPTRDGGVLHGVYFYSMSLREAVKRGAMPPLRIFNDFAACGYDDMPRDVPYLGKDQFMHGGIIEWEPFALTDDEYSDFLQYVRSLGGEFEIQDFGATTYQDWFAKCFT